MAPRHTDPSAGLLSVTVQHTFKRYLQLLRKGELTACISALDPELPFMTATALPLISVLDFCLFTTIWDDPKEFEAGRFAADILAVVIVGTGQLEG